MADFASLLVPGQLAFASNLAANKRHIVRLVRTAHEDDLAAGLTYEDPGYRRAIWSAVSLCGVQGRKSTYGNLRAYYWSPREGYAPDGTCGACLRAWRRLGEPGVAGWLRASPEDDWPWPLPYGWRRVPTGSHPWDVPEGGDAVSRVRDGTGKVVGQHRVEVLRWVRGPRIVRLVRHLDSDSDYYSARHWDLGASPEAEGYSVRSDLGRVRRACHELMATGGY